eukprot:gene3403-6755_t
MPTEATFSYSTAPLPVKPRKKFRDTLDDGPTSLMCDPRVVRGNTHAMARTLASMKRDNEQKTKPIKTVEIKPPESPSRPTYSYEVPEFVSAELDLSLYLIDNGASRPSVKVAETQADEFKYRPDTPEYVPRKTGIDRETQVEDVRDLFNFDAEVAPMLEVIIKKTIEQAIFEVEAEEELVAIEQAVIKFNDDKNAEIEWMREKEKEYEAELIIKNNHLQAVQKTVWKQRKVKRTVASSRAMKEIYPSILQEAADELFLEGIWKVQEKEDMVDVEIPALMVEAKKKMKRYAIAEMILDELLLEAQKLYDNTPVYIPPPKPRRLVIRIVLLAENVGTDNDVSLGPFAVSEADTVGSVEKRIEDEIKRRKVVLQSPPGGFLSSAMGRPLLPLSAPLMQFAFPENLDLTI